MTKREQLIRCLKREKITGHVPHFELVFFLTMEVLGKVHPQHRNYSQWDQMSKAEQQCHVQDVAHCYVDIARKYNHSAIFVQKGLGEVEQNLRLLEEIRNQSGDEFFLMLHGDPTFAIPDGDTMLDFSAELFDEPEAMLAKATRNTEDAIRLAEQYAKHPSLLDGIGLCSDYCFNVNPFFSPDMFAEFVQPFLSRILAEYRAMNLYTIKHTDGNILPIVDQIVECRPDALHSLDPQGGVDLAQIKREYGDKVCLMGNVNCALLQTGTLEECEKDIRRSLQEGMEGYGYIFSTSNCVYTGMPLERYELMHRIWREEGQYA